MLMGTQRITIYPRIIENSKGYFEDNTLHYSTNGESKAIRNLVFEKADNNINGMASVSSVFTCDIQIDISKIKIGDRVVYNNDNYTIQKIAFVNRSSCRITCTR